MIAAASYGHGLTVRQLIKDGSPVTLDVIGAAANNGHVAVVRLLFEADASFAWFYSGAMNAVAKNGHERVVRLCLELGGIGYNQVLKAAAKGGHTNVVLLMCVYGATDLLVGLQAAAREGHTKCAVWLYKRLLSQSNVKTGS